MEKEKMERQQAIKSFATELKSLLEKYDLSMEAHPIEIDNVDEEGNESIFVCDYSTEAVVSFYGDNGKWFTVRNVQKDKKAIICDHTDLTMDSENLIEL